MEAADAVNRIEIAYPSRDDESLVHAFVWEPPAGLSGAPKGVVQLVHGMAEHAARYDDFARYLALCGYVVGAADHIGHGRSVASPEQLGVMPTDGKEILIEDVHELRLILKKRWQNASAYVIFGHSMGSFVVRAYLARHGQGVDAAVVCGTGNQPLAASKAGRALARLLAVVRGRDFRSTFIDSIGAGAFAKAIEGARTPYDWLSTDPAVVDAFLADELSGQMFSVGAYATLTDLTGEIVTKKSASRIPKDLPVLFIAGAQDPVGECGRGVLAAADLFRACGVADVEVTLYEGMRHEILNEPDHERVYRDVTAWLESRLAPQASQAPSDSKRTLRGN
ncbi:alpha/beta fold hydrolase [Xiamenia xianingshaonis]|uniref:alpha/beta fold hydrolase n=1 Tax=Xiamenia xianingshaonis TaxID=2682776 RepID=UPI0028F745A0|nr:alpha/beta fold hydrolase [Xiamenia xianingshaonis]